MQVIFNGLATPPTDRNRYMVYYDQFVQTGVWPVKAKLLGFSLTYFPEGELERYAADLLNMNAFSEKAKLTMYCLDT